MSRQTIPSFCRICEASCGVLVDVEDGQILGVRGDPAHPSSQGLMCPKGALMAEVTHDPERLLGPVRRDGDGRFVPVSWDEALDDIATRVKALVASDGGDAVALYYGNPLGFGLRGYMALKSFTQGIGSTHGLYGPGPQDVTSRWVASRALFGNTHETPLPDLDHTDFFLCFGANPLVSHGSLVSSGRIRAQMAEIVERGGRVVVVDPARTKTAEAYEHVSVVPSSDHLLIAAMLNVIFAEGLQSSMAATQAIGIEALAAAVAPVSPESVEVQTGVEAAVIRSLARDFASAGGACAYGRTGICRGRYPTLANYLLDALNVVTGNLDRRGGVVFGHGLVDFPAIVAKTFGEAFETSRVGGLPVITGRQPWILAEEIMTPGRGQVKGVFLVSGNPVSSTPGAAALREAFQQLDLLVSIDLYITESNEYADYILPSPTFYERTDVLVAFGGGMTRPWTQWTEPVIPRIGDTREEHLIMNGILRSLGAEPGPEDWELVDQMIRTGERGRTEGWSLDKIKQHPHGVELGGEVPTGVIREKIRAHTRGERDQVDLGARQILDQLDVARRQQPPVDGQLLLFSRRHLRSINSWMHNPRKVLSEGGPTLYIHPRDAKPRGLRTGATAVLATEVGAAPVTVTVTDSIKPGSVSYPHGWGHSGGWTTAVSLGGVNINTLIPNNFATKDPLSGMSLLDGVPVTVSAAADADDADESPVGESAWLM